MFDSGLRGRGGAGFPAGIKWRTAAAAPAAQKYIVCNADEGDSGTFADRMVMEGDPFMLIEGMAIAGLAVGATFGYVYIRSEYPHAIRAMRRAIETARRHGLLGPSLLGSDHGFDMEVRVGAGAYVCGEETSLLESIEGRRGEVRAKPPLPAHVGLFGMPTIINNVLTLAAVPFILAEGAKAYADFGMGRSRGTMPIQIAGNVRNGGLFETAFGITLGELVDDIGGGTLSGRPVRAVQVGGPLGAYFPPSMFDLPFDYEAFAAADGLIGHAGHRRVRRQRRHGEDGPLRDGILRGGELRQVHALPDRLDPRHGGARPGDGRRGCRRQSRADRRSVRNDEIRIALRPGRFYPLSGNVRTEALP